MIITRTITVHFPAPTDENRYATEPRMMHITVEVDEERLVREMAGRAMASARLRASRGKPMGALRSTLSDKIIVANVTKHLGSER